MYCSIDKIDLAARVDGKPIAVQSDHRKRDEIEAEPELSVLFAMARVANARSQLADDGHPTAAVHYAVADDPPDLLREALIAAGATIERMDRKKLERLGPGSEAAVGALADRCMVALARRAARRVGSRDLAIALRMLEDQTFANPPSREDDEEGYWSRVMELAALAGELLRAKYPGRWIQSDRALVPFGFQLTSAGEPTIMFPTNRAQRAIEDGPDESLFKLLIAAEETLQRPTDIAAGRLMPSLRHRRDVVLEEVVWRPVVSDEAPQDLPIIVCGIDGESTFGMLRREALPKPPEEALDEAIDNVVAEQVQCDELSIGDDTILVITGSFYAAEKLLDREFMRTLHRDLGADLLAAATPSRGCLLVAGLTDEPVTIARFANLTRARHDESGGRSISAAVMLVSDGRVAGYVRGPGDQERPETLDRAETAPAVPKKVGFLRRLFGRK